MVLDTSALVAILCDEPEAPGIETAIERDSVRLLSAATLVETSIVHRGAIRRCGWPEPGSPAQQSTDRDRGAGRRAGRSGAGRPTAGSEKDDIPRALNYGDCFSYALASVRGEPLLFKGGDFAKTDIPRVVYTG
jgi:ribonuclease VapC